MTLQDIKNKLNMNTLNLEWSMDESNTKTEWLKEWNNEARLMIVMHSETADKIKSDPQRSDLILHTESRISQTKQQEYQYHLIMVKDNVAFTF
jgi:hypothetical protein